MHHPASAIFKAEGLLHPNNFEAHIAGGLLTYRYLCSDLYPSELLLGHQSSGLCKTSQNFQTLRSLVHLYQGTLEIVL